jgi:AcrR family transcriptional regulator
MSAQIRLRQATGIWSAQSHFGKGNSIEASGRSGAAQTREGLENAGRVLSPTDRDRILQAMIESCAERGYLQTTVSEVIARAAVRPESFEALFADKEQCALAALDLVMSEALARASGALAAAGERLAPGVRAGAEILELADARRSYAPFALIQGRQSAGEAMHKRYESGMQMLALALERVREEQPQSEPIPPAAVRAALGGVEAAIRAELAAPAPRRLGELLPGFIYGALVPLLGQRRALEGSRLAAETIAGSP